MKKLKTLAIILCFIFLVGCGNNTSKKALEEGKIALASLEYEKAKNLFKLALDEDSKNTEAEALLELVTNYIELNEVNENNDFKKIDKLVENIENNNKLSLIGDSYDKLKKVLLDRKERYDIYEKEVTALELLLKEEKYDEIEEIAYSKLEEFEEFSELVERVCQVISVVREKNEAEVDEKGKKNEKAKNEILKYHYNNTSIIFGDMMTFDSSAGVFAEVAELKGKTMYHFIEDAEDSPLEYVYDENTGDVFKLMQGQVFWMNNGEKHLNAQEISPPIVSEERITISEEEAINIVENYHMNKYKLENKDFFNVEISLLQDEQNKYLASVWLLSNSPRVVAEYYVNATTGEVTFLDN